MRPRQLSLPLTQDSTSYPLFCAFFAGESFLPKCWRQDFYCTKWVGACSLVFKASEDQDRLSLGNFNFLLFNFQSEFPEKMVSILVERYLLMGYGVGKIFQTYRSTAVSYGIAITHSYRQFSCKAH